MAAGRNGRPGEWTGYYALLDTVEEEMNSGMTGKEGYSDFRVESSFVP